MDYFRIPQWESFQHYRDRSPPWIKLQRDLLRDYRFTRLGDHQKAHLVMIWLLASQMSNRIPWDSDWIQAQIGATCNVDLVSLANAGFIEIVGPDGEPVVAQCTQPASKVQAGRKQSAMLETETEAERETERETEGEEHVGSALPTDVEIPLTDGSTFHPTADQIAEWSKAYPGVDVVAELRKCRQWNATRPLRRKTRRGVAAHITSWLARAQEKAKPSPDLARESARRMLFGDGMEVQP